MELETGAIIGILFAIALLILFGFWVHHRISLKKFKQNVHRINKEFFIIRKGIKRIFGKESSIHFISYQR
jgi:uncharacterized membrane protein YciS (DUF1049 family)